MEQYPVQGAIQNLIKNFKVYADKIQQWLVEDVLVFATFAEVIIQALVIGLFFLVARYYAPHLQRQIETQIKDRNVSARVGGFFRSAMQLMLPFIWLVLLWFAGLIADNLNIPHHPITVAVSLLTAWVIIRLGTALLGDTFWVRALAGLAWTMAALNIVDLLEPTRNFLETIAITFGETRVSILGVLRGVVSVAILLWLANVLSRVLEDRLKNVSTLTPSVQVLLGKFLRIVLYIIAFLIALESVGIDLTALAVFSGALGLGIGFGLQKIVSNLVSGVILLMDRSVKPGDVIAVDQTWGQINKLGARYVSIITRDGTEHLVPNDELINQKVENWSHSNDLLRIRVPVGISYNSDVKNVIELCLQAATEAERVLDEPKPVCQLVGFGDNSVNLELRFWIKDPRLGMGATRHSVLMRIWELFHEHNIEIPFPQRDLHIRSAVPFQVKPVKEDGTDE